MLSVEFCMQSVIIVVLLVYYFQWQVVSEDLEKMAGLNVRKSNSRPTEKQPQH